MGGKRVDRLNSLLREVISDIIRREVRHPDVPSLITVTRVDVTSDLRYAKVYISVIADDEKRQKAIEALKSAAGFIAVNSSKEVSLRYFPELIFRLDKGVDQQIRIEQILGEIGAEQEARPKSHDDAAGE